MPLTFSAVANLFLKLRRHPPVLFEDSSFNDEAPPSSQDPPLPPPTVPFTSDPQHNPSTPTASTPAQKCPGKRFSRGPPISHSKSSSSSSEPTSPSSPRYRPSFAPASAPVSPSSPRSPTRQKPQRTELTSGPEPLSHPGLVEAACERREPVERTDTYFCSGGVNVLILLRTTRAELMETVSLLGANAFVEEWWKCIIYGPRSNGTYKVQIRYKACGTRSTMPDPHQPVAVDQTQSIPGLMTILRRNDD